MFYIVSPPDATDWHLDQRSFVHDLRSDWPGVRILPPDPDSPTRAVVWSIEDPQGGSDWLEGSLDRDGHAHYLRGDISLAARFAYWLREKIDPTQPLVFTDEGFAHVIALADGDPVTRIVDAYTTAS